MGGGLVAIFFRRRTATNADRRRRVDFFRALGRSYAIVGNAALAVTLVCGALLLRSHPWTPAQVAAAGVAAALIVATVAGMLQARAMTRLRWRALESGEWAHRRCAGARGWPPHCAVRSESLRWL